MRIFHSIDALSAEVGAHLGHSDWHEVTQAQIDAFADATIDHQWIHVDPVRAASGPFGTTIAHGYLTLSLVPMLLDQVYKLEGPSMQVNYGADKLRFPAVLPSGSRIRVGAELLAVTPTAAGHQVRVLATVEREGGDKPVCVVELLYVAFP